MSDKRYKLINKILERYKKTVPAVISDIELEIATEMVLNHCEMHQKGGEDWSVDAKSISCFFGLTQKKVKDICKANKIKLSKKPDLRSFGIDTLSDQQIEEVLENEDSFEDLYNLIFSFDTSFFRESLENIKNMEFVDLSNSQNNKELVGIATSDLPSENMIANDIWYLEEVIKMLKKGEISQLCLIGKKHDGGAISIIPKNIDDEGADKILVSVIQELERSGGGRLPN